jgi:hypothetical protein
MGQTAALKFALAGGIALMGLAASPALAADCGKLAGSLSLPDGKVTSAALVPSGGFQPPAAGPLSGPPGAASLYSSLPTFCRVQATLTPSLDSDIKVEVWLPAKNWNGKYVGVGNGVWAGQITYSALAETLKRGYAVASTDTGHVGNGLSAEFGVGYPDRLVDFGHRAVHEMTVTAKRAIAEFYGKAPRFSLWNSCSTGGRQGLMEAHRYPEDYDAISAMAPANPMTELMVQSMWAGIRPHRSPGAQLSFAQLGLLHGAAIKQCDTLDGLADGIIGRPDACEFDPAKLQCTAGAGDTCLTPDQVGTARALYDGVHDRAGNFLLPGWPAGAEMQLAVLIMAPEPFPVALTYYKLLVNADQPNWDFRTFDFRVDAVRGRNYGASMFDVAPTGLAPFFARGGKLLLSHGWTDGLIPPENTLNFYGALYPTLSDAQQQSQVRLFMVPGMDHCGGGEGTSQFDTLGTIDQWATTGSAPFQIAATRPAGPIFQGGPSLPAISRPLCAYPLYAKYNGSGPEADAASFTCVEP